MYDVLHELPRFDTLARNITEVRIAEFTVLTVRDFRIIRNHQYRLGGPESVEIDHDEGRRLEYDSQSRQFTEP